MFTSKKKKIHIYLESIPVADKTGFDLLLHDYLNGTLKSNLEDMGVTKIDIHIDWYDSMRCIGVHGRFKKYYMDMQIYPDEFCLSFDLEEPDEDETYPMKSKDYFYQTLANTIYDLV